MEKNGFAKNLDIDLKINLLGYQNNYVGRSNWLLQCQNFLQHCSLRLSILQNNFDSIKLFSDLAKFLDTSRKSFPCVSN